jgi:hypothetical protein
MAAGFFTKVKDELEKNPTSAEGNDLSGDAVTLLVNLMLAQAQESFYERVRIFFPTCSSFAQAVSPH